MIVLGIVLAGKMSLLFGACLKVNCGDLGCAWSPGCLTLGLGFVLALETFWLSAFLHVVLIHNNCMDMCLDLLNILILHSWLLEL